jgi:phosphohistidine phosphatase
MIWLLRHGDAEEGSPDFDRRLTAKGERQARKAGEGLRALGVRIDSCLASPKLRAADTARIACEPLDVGVTLEPALEGGSFDAEALAAGHGDVLLVGHEPDFSETVRSLTGACVRMKKGGVAGIDGGELKVLLRPKDLSAILA